MESKLKRTASLCLQIATCDLENEETETDLSHDMCFFVNVYITFIALIKENCSLWLQIWNCDLDNEETKTRLTQGMWVFFLSVCKIYCILIAT